MTRPKAHHLATVDKFLSQAYEIEIACPDKCIKMPDSWAVFGTLANLRGDRSKGHLQGKWTPRMQFFLTPGEGSQSEGGSSLKAHVLKSAIFL